jgi:hypothetical protein
MIHAQTSFSTEICAGAIISVVQYLAPLRYADASLFARAREHLKQATLAHFDKEHVSGTLFLHPSD